MSFEPTPRQALLLFGLLAKHGECRQAELMPKVEAKDREALVKARLVAVEKIGRSYQLTLTDAGWGWAGDHLAADLPPAQGALRDLLARLNEHLAKSGETLADFIGSKPAEAKAAKPKAPTPAALRKRIGDAYLAITDGKTDQSVKLSRLRVELADLDRSTLDAALGRILSGDKKASLMRHDDPRQLDETDHDAAFNPAGEPFHVIWIAS